jgi:predicted nucleic acid-binding protein
VYQELKVDTNLPGSVAILSALQSGWLSVQSIQDEKLVRALRFGLDYGEAEAIGLGIELNSLLVLTDIKDGWVLACDMGLTVTGTLGVLLKAKFQ